MGDGSYWPGSASLFERGGPSRHGARTSSSPGAVPRYRASGRAGQTGALGAAGNRFGHSALRRCRTRHSASPRAPRPDDGTPVRIGAAGRGLAGCSCTRARCDTGPTRISSRSGCRPHEPGVVSQAEARLQSSVSSKNPLHPYGGVSCGAVGVGYPSSVIRFRTDD